MYHFWHDRKKCCVLSRLPVCPYGTPRGRDRAHLRTSAARRRRRSWRSVLDERFLIKRPFSERDFLLLFSRALIYLLSALSLSLALFYTYYVSSPNSRRSPWAHSSSFSRPRSHLPSSLSSSCPLRLLLPLSSSSSSPSFSSTGVELAVEVPPSPSRPSDPSLPLSLLPF